MTEMPNSKLQLSAGSEDSARAISNGVDIAVHNCSLFDYLESAAEDFPDRPWISIRDQTISYQVGLSLVNKLAAGLAAQGIIKGDRLAVCLPNDTFYPLFAFACWRQGIILVGINSLYAVPMLTNILSDSQPKMIVTRDEPLLLARIRQAQEACPHAVILALPQHGNAIRAIDAPDPRSDNALTFHTLVMERSPQLGSDTLDPVDDVAVLQYTGGTTGSPKGAMLTHANVSSCVSQLSFGMDELRRGEEKYIAIGPFAHVIGTTLILATVTSIASEILIESRFHPEDTVQMCLEHKVTVLFGVPTMFGAIAASPCSDGADWSNLRYAMCGGAPLPKQIAKAFESVTGCRLLQGYGLSESASGIAFSPPGLDLPEGAVGYPIAASQVQIRSLQDRSILAAIGEVGEICATGPQIMKGYWRQPDRTAEVMTGTFLATGDTGYIDETGAIHIVDRIKDLIITSGYNVYPSVIEEVLYGHPAIREAAVVGQPDAYRGEIVKAVVSLHSGQSLDLEMLQNYLRPKLSPIEIPKQLEILDELPKTAIGKISKLDLR